MKVNPIPEGFHTVTPYLAVKGTQQLVEFLKKAFSAEVNACHRMPDGTILNAEITIGTSKIMVGDPHGEQPVPAMLYLYVEDADLVYKKAMQAGAKSIMEPMDQFYGDRAGAVEDASGNKWWIATRKENVPEEELNKRMAKMKKQ